jgi:predicted nucleic acid-binding protein
LIVLDASSVVELVLGLAHGAEVAGRIEGNETLHAPHLLSAEVTKVIRRYELRGDIDANRSTAALTDTADLDVNYYDHLPLLARVWELRRNVSAYDGLYLSLAEALDAPLLTGDSTLASVPGIRASIEVFGASS